MVLFNLLHLFFLITGTVLSKECKQYELKLKECVLFSPFIILSSSRYYPIKNVQNNNCATYFRVSEI
jgi:hypothetical protein